MKIIDSHIHIENRNAEDLALMSMAGVSKVVSMVWHPQSFSFTSDAIFAYYDRAIKWEPVRTRMQLIETYVGVGISMVAVPTDWERVIEKLPGYLENDRVVCVGEIGIEPASQCCKDLGLQEEIFRTQLEFAKKYDLPVDIHTPFKEQEKWIEKYAAIIEDVGNDKNRVILDHMKPESVQLAWDTGCVAGMTVQPWRKLTGADAAKIVEKGGPLERFVIDSDCSQSKASDSLSVPKAVFEMRKLGIDEATIEQIVYHNPSRIFHLPE